MQYALFGRKKAVEAKVAQAWFKMPKRCKVSPVLNSNDIVQMGSPIGVLEVLVSGRPRMLQIAELKATHKLKTIKGKFNKPVTMHGWNRCQLTGKILPITSLEFIRIYDKMILVQKGGNFPSLAYLVDKDQHIELSRLKELNIVTFKGSKEYYASSEDWLLTNREVTFSPDENSLVLNAESKQVYLNRDGAARRFSNLELAKGPRGGYYRCPACNRYMKNGAVHPDTGYCPHCMVHRATNRPERNEQVYNYSHKVENDLGFDKADCELIKHLTHPKTKDPLPVYLGVELEFNVQEDKLGESAKFINKTGYALCKSDSSISANGAGAGYEIVTQPCSLTKHKKMIATILDKYGKYFKASDTCGIHVHVSRAPFTDSDIGKILSFLHREDNRAFIMGMARRESHRYARLTDSYIKENKQDPSRIKRGAKSMLSRERYTALNVKDATIEFRIFAASTDISVIMASVQFCEAVCMYAKAHTTSAKYSALPLTKWADISNFLAFLKDSNTKTIVKPSTDNQGPVYETTQKYAELEEYIITNKLPISSKTKEEVLYTKVKKSLDTNLLPVFRHREIPKKVSEDIIKNLLANRPVMLRWLTETTEGRGGKIMFSDQSKSWELRTGNAETIYQHTSTSEQIVA